MSVVKTISQHDKIFKQFLSKTRFAKEFLQHYLSPKVLKQCDLSTLAIQPTNFISLANRECYADILYQLKFKGKPAYIFVLLEHQSTPDALMVLRVLRYQLEVIYHHAENHKTSIYPIIIPLVFYTGNRKWNYPLTLAEYFDNPTFAMETLFGKLNIIPIQNIADEEILQHKRLSALEIIQKYIGEKDAKRVCNIVVKALAAGEKLSDELATSVLRYLLEAGKLEDPDIFLKLLTEQAPEYEEAAMNAGEILIKRGLKRGIQQGIEQGMQQGIEQGMQQGIEQGMQQSKTEIARNMLAIGIDIKTIAKCTKLSAEQLEKLMHSTKRCSRPSSTKKTTRH